MSEQVEILEQITLRIARLERIIAALSKGLAGQRAGMIQQLGAIEDTLGYERSITPRHKREK